MQLRVLCCAENSQPGSYEPVEQGVTLPPISSHEGLKSEGAWLGDAISGWLDREWYQTEPNPIHATIGELVAQIYVRQRMEGEDDLSGVLLAIGQELESLDMRDAFVGPFNVANKAAEILLSEFGSEHREMPKYERSPDAPVWSPEKDAEIGAQRKRDVTVGHEEGVGKVRAVHTGATAPPSLADRFDRLIFLKRVLDGSASPAVVSGAVALVVGFKFDRETGSWDGSSVKDTFFRSYGGIPPSNVLEDADAMGYLAARLLDSEDSDSNEEDELAESLDVVIEALHGTELTQILRTSGDVEFAQREIVVKFLHLHGGF